MGGDTFPPRPGVFMAPVSLPPGKPFIPEIRIVPAFLLRKPGVWDDSAFLLLPALHLPFPSLGLLIGPGLAGMSRVKELLKGRRSCFPRKPERRIFPCLPEPGRGRLGSTVKRVCHQKATSLVPCPRLLTFPSGILAPDPGIINPGAAR